jgi:hypothetical protein
MRRFGWALVVVLTAGQADARPKPAAPAPAMAVSDWVSLEPSSGYAARAGLIKPLNTAPPAENTDNVFVYARRGGNKEQNWREDLRPAASTYEASNSDASIAPHASYPEWDSPQEERTMSAAKDALGLCGFGPFTCPGGN